MKRESESVDELTAQLLTSLQRLRALAMGGVSAMVMGTLTGNSALLQRSASVSAPPLDATSSIVRLRGGRSGPSCGASLGLGGRAASRRASSRAAGPGAGAGEASPPTATPGKMPNLQIRRQCTVWARR